MRRLHAACGVLASVLLGCGGSGEYELAPISGKVTLNGEPLADARVTFEPAGGGEAGAQAQAGALGSLGTTDSGGRYLLSTFDGKSGAVVGNHKVTVSTAKYKEQRADIDLASDILVHEKVPTKYNSSRDGLTFVVKAGGTDAANFELAGSPPPAPKDPPAPRRATARR